MKFRRRFSIRTLVIFVTLVCAYFGAWEATEKYGIEGLETQRVEVNGETIELTLFPGYFDYAPGPFVIYREWDRWIDTYYLWFFGFKIRLFDVWKSEGWIWGKPAQL